MTIIYYLSKMVMFILYYLYSNISDQLQDVLFGVDVGKGVIVHGLLEVDGIEDLDAVRLINDLAVLILHGLSVLPQLGCAPLEHFSALHQDGALGVCDHIRTVHLHQI